MTELSSPAAVVEIGTAATWVRKWSSLPWVRGPLWDGFWMLSAIWLAPIVLLLAHGYSNPESSPLDLLYFGLTALVLDWSPIVEHLPRVLHGSVSAAAAGTADPVRRAASVHNSRMFCALSAGRLSVAMDARGTTYWIGNYRLRLRDVPFRGATFRCAFTLPFASGSRLRAFRQGAGIASSRSLPAACLCLSRISSPEQSRIKTSGSIAGFRRGLYQLRMESAAARCWRCLPSRQSC